MNNVKAALICSCVLPQRDELALRNLVIQKKPWCERNALSVCRRVHGERRLIELHHPISDLCPRALEQRFPVGMAVLNEFQRSKILDLTDWSGFLRIAGTADRAEVEGGEQRTVQTSFKGWIPLADGDVDAVGLKIRELFAGDGLQVDFGM